MQLVISKYYIEKNPLRLWERFLVFAIFGNIFNRWVEQQYLFFLIYYINLIDTIHTHGHWFAHKYFEVNSIQFLLLFVLCRTSNTRRKS